MQKLFEIKGQDWMKGLSVQTGMALGGLFQTASGFDPFERIGFLQPALAATELTVPSTNPIKTITHWNDGSTQYLYAQSNSKLYRYLRSSPFTQTDVTAEITVNNVFCGGIIWPGGSGDSPRYVYSIKATAGNPTVRSNTLPVASANDVEINAGLNEALQDIVPFCIGADKKLYAGHFGSVASFANNDSAGTTDAFLIDRGHTVRGMVNDGRYLVIFSDNNAPAVASKQIGNYSCRGYFWDMAKSSADIIWDFPGESYLIGAATLGSAIIVFGYNGIYVCNAVTPPKMIASFLGNSTLVGKRPTHCYQIASSPTSVFWGDGGINGASIYAYGSLPGSSERIFYSPYITHTSTYAHTAISTSANLLFAAVDAPKFYVHNTGSTRGNTTANISPYQFSQPVRYGYAKVVLRDKLSSGQAVAFSATTAGGLVISDTETKNYSSANPRKNLKFDITPATDSQSVIEDLSFTINPQAGATVERISIYGTPLPDADANL